MAPTFDHGSEWSTSVKFTNLFTNNSSYCWIQERRVIWTRIKGNMLSKKLWFPKRGLRTTRDILRKRIKNKEKFEVNKRKWKWKKCSQESRHLKATTTHHTTAPNIQLPWNSPKTNSLHCSLIVVTIPQNPVCFPVLQFSISLHYIHKQATTINSIYTHISPNHPSLYPHQSNLSVGH
jgi:hypothetical protein